MNEQSLHVLPTGQAERVRSEPAGCPARLPQGGPVGFGEAVSGGLKNVFTFNGRASRSAFWWYALFAFIIAMVIDIIGAVTGVGALSYIADAIIAIESVALQVRRLHDIGHSGFWCFISLIPVIGGIALLVFDCLPGTQGPNKYDAYQ